MLHARQIRNKPTKVWSEFLKPRQYFEEKKGRLDDSVNMDLKGV